MPSAAAPVPSTVADSGTSRGEPAEVDGDGLMVQVAAGTAQRQEVRAVTLPPGATVIDAVRLSDILASFPELATVELDYSVHGVRADPGQALATGDRVEVLRPLQVEPRESRRRRALKSPRS